MKPRAALPFVFVLTALPAGSASSSVSTARARVPCSPARVQYAPYPGGDGRMSKTPWVRGTPSELGLVGLLWYWPESWRQQRVETASIYTGGTVPAGSATKILWAFVAPSAKGHSGYRLVVQGRRLDGPGRSWQQFAPISYAGQQGAPSFASIIDLPAAGCWRLQLSAGDLRASVVFRAIQGTS